MTDKPITVGELSDTAPTKYIVSTNNSTSSFSEDEFNVAVAYFTWKKSFEGGDCKLYLAKPMIRIA